MVGNIGLGKFNPIDLKESKASSAPKSLSKNSKEDSILSNDSSASKTKTLEKSENKSNNNSQKNSVDKNSNNNKSEFSKKVEGYTKSQEKENPSEVSVSSDGKKLTKKQIEESQQEINSKGSNVSEIPQMMMLQGVQPVHVNAMAEPKVSGEKSVELNIDGKVSAQTQPILKFMKAMQENFGIQPEQIMKALSQMPQETLMESPHKAMTPLFEKLGLQPKQFTKAQILYTEMLTEMEQVKPELFKGGIATGAAAGALGASAASSPILTPVAGAPAVPVHMMDRPAIAPKSTLDQLIEQKISRRALEPQNMQGVIAKAPQQQPANMAQIFQIDPATQPMLGQDTTVALDKLSEFDPQLRIQDVKINPNRISEQFSSDATALGAAAVSIPVLGKEFQSDMSDENKKDELFDQSIQMPGDKKLDGQFAMDKIGPAAAAGVVAGAPKELSNENVEKIISGSQSLIKKGGGEMKIQLNPEGLGKVHLDIKVQDGQVGVQMMADTQEAKKLLESSMSDLKLSLAEHKLNLNSVKVDVSEQASNNMNPNHDSKRDEARDFLGQFRQFNESFRNGSDMTAARAYRKPPPQPTPDAQPIQSKNKTSSADGRLHLVA